MTANDPVADIALVGHASRMGSLGVALVLLIGFAAWCVGAAIYLPWWFKKFRREQASLSWQQAAVMIASFATFALAIWISVRAVE
ncbi:hypothetical protein ACX0GZ_09300 [Sphingomonas aestuarii]|jgi:hypothetical protein